MPFKTQDPVKKNFTKITISLASSDAILARSYGEVSKPETINYRSFRPEKDGLFCEKIFGPVRDWECHCGKYKRIRYKGIICDRCGVEVTQKSVRRERMGHISLAVPVVHIWYFRSLPSKIANILGISSKELEKIIYYENYVVINPGPTGFPKPFSSLDTIPNEDDPEKLDKALFRNDITLLTEEEYLKALESLPPSNQELDDDDPDKFIACIGGEAIKRLLRMIDVEKLAERLRYQIRVETSQQKKQDAIKRLRVVSAFVSEEGEPRNKPEWMVLDVIPVIPPELRPLVPLEGGRFATSDLNDLYRRVIIRNNRLKRLIDIKAPEVILRNEKRMLQEAVDSLFDNSRRVNSVRSENNRALKSLSDMLKGKQGRFRQNLLGKRVDYSGRSVIVVGPEMKLHQCGLPKDMAVELFKPFIIRKLIERGIVKTVKSAKKVVDKKGPEVWDILEKIIDGHPVLLNRAPTLHRLGIQAFQPLLIEGKAIRLHPLVCTAFNADFDGDQMAVHVPLSFDAQLESMILLLSAHNILSPQNGTPIAIPNQEIVLGCYYLTKALPGDLGEGKVFSSMDEAVIAFDQGRVGLHARVKLRVPLPPDQQREGRRFQMIDTTMGRIIFNRTVPKEIGFVNELLTKRRLVQLIGTIFHRLGNLATVRFLDDLKDLGFGYATTGGLSISISDIEIPAEKNHLIERAQEEVEKIHRQYQHGFITNGERYNKVIDIWTRTTNRVADKLFDTLQVSQNGFNSLYMMMDSGARGSKEQVRQLAGMRGLMAKPQKSMTGQTGEIIENPITANFRDGLSILEYFISTHGARKGLADTALKTADAGYLTRRLVDVAQDVAVTEQDCGTIRGVSVEALKEGEDIKEPLHERILGRVSLLDVRDPLTGEMLVEAGQLIDEDRAAAIARTSIESVVIRSVLTCEAKRGVCAKCYGRNLTSGRLVDVGEAVGIIAAQSIGEPGTQLTLRTFHIGGTASRIAAQSQISTRFEGRVQFEGLKYVERVDDENTVLIAVNRNGVINILDNDNRVISKYDVPYGASIVVSEGRAVARGEVLYEWDPYNATIISEHAGIVRFTDLHEGRTYREEPDEQTGHIQKVVIDSKDKSLNPTIQVLDPDSEAVLVSYPTPVRAHLTVEDGQRVSAGAVLVKIPREIGKTRDITGGLPRVTELFEARSPQNPSIVSEIDGVVTFGAMKRGSREIVVTSHDGSDVRTYLAPIGRHVLVQQHDHIRAGEPLTDGAVNPHDILRIKGAGAVQEYLVNEIQEVYRMQGVKINDKHIEVIVRQMLQKVRIISPGDTRFLEGDVIERFKAVETNEELADKVVITVRRDTKFKRGQIVPKKKVREVNLELKKKGKEGAEYRDAEPASYEPVLLGITQASLTTESWISAASFQETTKVLTEAAIESKADYLLGLKENVIIGHLIPAGTGLKKFRNLMVMPVAEEETAVAPATDAVRVEA
ncbi:MAG: DNA-directed RNA polymerase subunit beta' [Bacteroidota bacterium]|nr:DNA-directed RNA polymerase subunit beta' [Bacteroidota bacterium]